MPLAPGAQPLNGGLGCLICLGRNGRGGGCPLECRAACSTAELRRTKASVSPSGRNRDKGRERQEKERKLLKHPGMSAGGRGNGRELDISSRKIKNFKWKVTAQSLLGFWQHACWMEVFFLLNQRAQGFAYTSTGTLGSWSFQKQKCRPLFYLLS